ncbi:hypothetical protein SAMN05421823_103667 [Catalinimonas alkaloidigena]|uniref:Lon N-terminal domain-containing protein n=1 Tax=Catalinimonas alkaloidigena TaxID=1075417 RepID=A0A1G9F434_9BACT|nr:LON peptidase substrate-binding domain-containing protein [Catalinimonas alkaloidigena]SDK83127.1 hypothetical protein SAMN05421823_103667 [Catalinimonas alkaloidigena]
MTTLLPFFPLNLVVYPQEALNLHVFEPRYKQLISDCLQEEKTFGIPAYLDEQVSEYGTEVRILSVEKRYDDGRMDIRTEGVRVFLLQSLDNPMADKLYAGGEVRFMPDHTDEDPNVRAALLFNVEQLYSLLNLRPEFRTTPDRLLSYEIAHKIGLSLHQEYELLKFRSETERQTYLSEHLKRTLPVVSEIERTKARIRMNGHFRHLDPLNF